MLISTSDEVGESEYHSLEGVCSWTIKFPNFFLYELYLISVNKLTSVFFPVTCVVNSMIAQILVNKIETYALKNVCLGTIDKIPKRDTRAYLSGSTCIV